MSDVSIEALDEHIAVVCLHRPPNNFFDTALLVALAEAYEELAASQCRVVVLRSEGKHFCAGLDFVANREQDIAELYRNALRLFAAPPSAGGSGWRSVLTSVLQRPKAVSVRISPA
jgi:enoyl-CoA hydratase/carnithine racemase